MMNSSCKVISSHSLTIEVLPVLQKSTAQATLKKKKKSPQRLIAIKHFVSFSVA